MRMAMLALVALLGPLGGAGRAQEVGQVTDRSRSIDAPTALAASLGGSSGFDGTPAVVVSLGNPEAASGSEVDFRFAIDRGGFAVGIVQILILLSDETRELVYEPVAVDDEHPNDVDCQVEADLAEDFSLLAVVEPESAEVIVSLLPNIVRFPAIPRDGVFARCRFRVRTGIAAGRYPLRCDQSPDAASASGPEGDILPIRCEDGEITVREPMACRGDCDGTGGVTVDELVRGVGIVSGAREVQDCLALDANQDERGTIDELLVAVRAALDGCE